jgi:hypothetical protein
MLCENIGIERDKHFENLQTIYVIMDTTNIAYKLLEVFIQTLKRNLITEKISV